MSYTDVTLGEEVGENGDERNFSEFGGLKLDGTEGKPALLPAYGRSEYQSGDDQRDREEIDSEDEQPVINKRARVKKND